jgi:electron transport complex protein RnfG
MKEAAKYGFILFLICTIASGMLAVAYSITKTRIAQQARAEEEAGLKQVIAEAVRFEPVKSGGELAYYKAYDSAGKLCGIAFKASGKGYSSNIDTLVGLGPDGAITGIKVLSQNETPGLGARIVEQSFTGQFIKYYPRDVSGVQTISGATISSRAVIDSVKRKADEIQKILK